MRVALINVTIIKKTICVNTTGDDFYNVVITFAGSCRIFYAALLPPDSPNSFRRLEGKIPIPKEHFLILIKPNV